jgi:hypothetical protein
MVHDQETAAELLTANFDNLMERVGEDILGESGTNFAHPPSRHSIIVMGKEWWQEYKTNSLCPAIRNNEMLRRTVFHKIGVPQVDHVLTIAALLIDVGQDMNYVRALVVSVIVVRETVSVLCPDESTTLVQE